MIARDNSADLLDAVDGLTKPVRSRIIQDGPIGSGLEGQKTVTVELPPLLDQLNNAIRGQNVKGSSGSLPSQRNMLDGDALHRFMTIAAMIKDWARMAGAAITPDDPKATLRAWYLAYQLSNPNVEQEKFYTRKMVVWAGQITAKLDPGRVWDLPHPCPVCEASLWFNPVDKLPYPRPLIVNYHETGPNLIQEAVASCRACETRWGVRELAHILDHWPYTKKCPVCSRTMTLIVATEDVPEGYLCGSDDERHTDETSREYGPLRYSDTPHNSALDVSLQLMQ